MASEKLLHLIPTLYDAAICGDKWEDALDMLVDHVGGKSAMLFAIHNTFESFSLAKGGGTLRGAHKTFADYSFKFRHFEEEAMAVFAKSPPQTLIRDVDVWPDLEMLKGRADFQYVREHVGAFDESERVSTGTLLGSMPAPFISPRNWTLSPGKA